MCGVAERKFNAKESMMMAQNKNAVIGSSTCILAILENNILDVANVGDSELKIIRDGKIIFSTQVKPTTTDYGHLHRGCLYSASGA